MRTTVSRPERFHGPQDHPAPASTPTRVTTVASASTRTASRPTSGSAGPARPRRGRSTPRPSPDSPPAPPRPPSSPPAAVALWLRHAEQRYADNPNEAVQSKHVCRPLCLLFGPLAASEFGPRQLKELRRAMADGSWNVDAATGERKGEGGCRNVVNRQMTRQNHLAVGRGRGGRSRRLLREVARRPGVPARDRRDVHDDPPAGEGRPAGCGQVPIRQGLLRAGLREFRIHRRSAPAVPGLETLPPRAWPRLRSPPTHPPHHARFTAAFGCPTDWGGSSAIRITRAGGKGGRSIGRGAEREQLPSLIGGGRTAGPGGCAAGRPCSSGRARGSAAPG